jgi:hypothetical protein
MSVEYEFLYLMADPLASQSIRLEPYANNWLGQAEAVSLLRAQLVPPAALKLRPAMGARFVDVLWTTFPPIRVISGRLLDLLSANELSGVGIYDVEVKDREGRIQSDYFGLAIRGRAGEQDLRRVQLIQKSAITKGGAPYTNLKGVYFENDVWDGSDFTLMGSSLMVIVSERVVETFARAKVRNVRFTPLPDVEILASVYEVMGLWPPK